MPTKHASPLLLQVLNGSANLNSFTALDWDLLIRQARASRLLARLGSLLEPHKTQIPLQVWRHFASDMAVANEIKRSISWEAARIHEALAALGIKIIFLKGAAYTLANLNAGQGRLYQDTDILVPKTRLADVEKMLMWYGWLDQKQDVYDQRYYREWMHELPPKQHRGRGAILDVHHNILPETCALSPNADLLFEAAVPIANTPYWMLSPADQVLHSASHLFWNGEFDHGLRDLCDLDSLIRHAAAHSDTFWPALLQRAEQLGFGKPLFYALRYSRQFLNTPIPEDIIRSSSRYAPGLLRQFAMDILFNRALRPNHSSCQLTGTGLAKSLLYVRSHWLRMPLYLLIPHLFTKTFHKDKNNA